MEVLKPYRDRIDDLDDRIVDLLAERYAIIREVGHFKAGEDIPPILEDRVEEVRERAARRAADKGLDPDFVRQLYTLMIDYAHDIEKEIIKAA
ncbi:MAG: chorismate mutase [Rhodospirillales bacterium]|nr:chorismate mutase [Rhodospirillales bacterium]